MSFDILEGHNFMNLTTYYPDGRGRTTPGWFAREGDTLYVVTGAESYKVKRLRGNPRCEVQPCDRAGTPLDEGPTAPGVASIHSPGTAAGSEANQALPR
ncbi:MAG: pyridoxamine 5'-phosphate oxidase family protein, partial [Anaerolineae bacterium]